MLFGLEAGTLLVFAVVLVTVALFVTEALPPDVVAIGVVVTLVVFRPLTGVGTEEALSGFSSTATVTILAMYVLSQAVQETGLVRRLGEEVSLVVRGSESRLVAAVVALTGPIAGVVNNTPVVAVFIPMVSELAEEAGVSPSKVLLPLSYASMLGGTLTLVGTATNLVASDAYVAAARRAGVPAEPFSMFEFTTLGALVLVVGSAYLLTVGRALTPARIEPGDRTAGYDVGAHLARVLVPSRSPLVGEPVSEVVADARRDLELDVETEHRLLKTVDKLLHGPILRRLESALDVPLDAHLARAETLAAEKLSDVRLGDRGRLSCTVTELRPRDIAITDDGLAVHVDVTGEGEVQLELGAEG